MIKRDIVKPTKTQHIVIRDGRRFHAVATCEPHQQFTSGMDCDVYETEREAREQVTRLGGQWPED